MNKNAKDIDEYIASQSDDVKDKLVKLRQTIQKAAPDATEVISYQMPAFKYYGMLAYFAAFKNHYSLFISPKIIESFKEELKEFETSKGTIRFPKEKPVPVRLVTKIVKSAAVQNLEKAITKGKIKAKY
jgi:uncharacterized protein YdhG (YjbR/CyaY superfamily)